MGLLKKAKPKEEKYVPRREDAPSGHGGNHDESNWLVSYADMMTLLCGFFIMLFSMAKLDEPQFEKVKESVAKQFGGDYQSPHKELAKFVTQILQEAGIEKDAMVEADPSGVSVVFQSTIFFDTLGTDVRPQGKILLDQLISKIALRQDQDLKKYKIVVEGHTDSRPILSGVYPSNWELSGARASRVVRMFMDKGFAPNHLIAIGYADTHPVAEPRTETGAWNEAALAKNRRVVLRILDPKVDAIPIPGEKTPADPATGEARMPAGGAPASIGPTGPNTAPQAPVGSSPEAAANPLPVASGVPFAPLADAARALAAEAQKPASAAQASPLPSPVPSPLLAPKTR